MVSPPINDDGSCLQVDNQTSSGRGQNLLQHRRGSKIKWGSMTQVRTPFPKFGHLPVKLKSSLLHGEKKIVNIVNEMLVLKLSQLSKGDLFLVECLQHLQTLC